MKAIVLPECKRKKRTALTVLYHVTVIGVPACTVG